MWHWVDFYLRRPFENATDFTSIWASIMSLWPHNGGYRTYKAGKNSLPCFCNAYTIKMIAHIDRNGFSLIKLENWHLCHTNNTKPWIISIKIFPKGENLSPGGFWTLTPWCNMISNKTLYMPQNTLQLKMPYFFWTNMSNITHNKLKNIHTKIQAFLCKNVHQGEAYSDLR